MCNVSKVDDIINSISHTIYSEVVVIHIGDIRNIAGVGVERPIVGNDTCDIPLFTGSSDNVVVHTFCTIHWRLETDHSR